MPVIEGVGDEVLNFLLIALIVALGIVGWWSTSISEQPLIRTVLILEPRHHTSTENTTSNTAPSPPQDTGQADPVETNDVRPEPADAPNPSPSSTKSEGSAEQPSIEECNPGSSSSHSQDTDACTSTAPPLSPSDTVVDADPPPPSNEGEPSSNISTDSYELRRRRLQFFGDRQDVDSVEQTCSTQSDDQTKVGDDCVEASTSSSNNQETRNPKDIPTVSDTTSSDPCRACDDIRIRLKFLNDNQKLVQGKLQEPLGDFKRRNFAVEMDARKVIRLIFNGQVLQSDDRTLQNYGLFDNCVVHCLVHNQRASSPNVENATNGNIAEDLHFGGVDVGESREWDLSNVMYISMFVILAGIWYLRINFSQLFSATSTVALFGLSGIFVIFLVGMYIPDQEVLRT